MSYPAKRVSRFTRARRLASCTRRIEKVRTRVESKSGLVLRPTSLRPSAKGGCRGTPYLTKQAPAPLPVVSRYWADGLPGRRPVPKCMVEVYSVGGANDALGAPQSVDGGVERLLQQVRPRQRRRGSAAAGRMAKMAGDITPAAKEWLKKYEVWVASDVGQKTINENLNGLAKLMGVPESECERFAPRPGGTSAMRLLAPRSPSKRATPKTSGLRDAELKIRAAHKAVERLCNTKKKYRDFNFGTGVQPRGLERVRTRCCLVSSRLFPS